METRIDGSNHQGSATQILVTVFSPDLLASSLRLATQLRAAGFKVEMYLNSDRLPNQLRYANRKGINYCTILGPDEADAGSVVLKDMNGRGPRDRRSRPDCRGTESQDRAI